jgi:hypothetical protein
MHGTEVVAAMFETIKSLLVHVGAVWGLWLLVGIGVVSATMIERARARS